MVVVKETAGAKLLEKDGVRFWVQRRWVRADGALTPAGVKAFAIARKNHFKHWSFDALKAFAPVKETEKAVLLRCAVELPHEHRQTTAEFWVPRAMTGDYQFVKGKVAEVEQRFPFIGSRVLWGDDPRYPDNWGGKLK